MLSAPHEPACITRLRARAPGLSQLYFASPVYLVGGAARGDQDPRDLDLIVELSDELFVFSYGENEAWSEGGIDAAVKKWCHDDLIATPGPLWLRWARDCAKQSMRLTKWCHRRVDFKTQAAFVAAGHELSPRVVLWPPLGAP